MTHRQKAFAIAGGLLGLVVVLCLLSRVLPLSPIALLQQRAQTRMHCWVKVVDQDGKGVPGYKCRVVEEHAPQWFLSSGKDVVRIFDTSDDGTFEYKSRGATGRVYFGYDIRSQWRNNPRHLMQDLNLVVTSADYRKAMRDQASGHLGSHANPYVINVFSVGQPQKLLYWKQPVQLRDSVNYICIDLLSGRLWESKTPEGNVAMADGQFGQHGEIPSCFIKVIAGKNCALYPVVDDWGLEPPEKGFVRELCCDKDWQEKRNWTYNSVEFYYQLMEPHTEEVLYGRLTLGLSPRVRGARIETYTNLQGQRNLYYDGYTDFDRNREIRSFVSPPVHVVSGQAKAP